MQRGTAKDNNVNLGRVYASLSENGDTRYSSGDILMEAAQNLADEQEQARQNEQQTSAQEDAGSAPNREHRQNAQKAPESVPAQEQTNPHQRE